MWSNQENRVRKQVKNPCEARKIKTSHNLHKIISTRLLTVLIISVILQLEQRERVQKQELDSGGSHSGSADGLEDIRSQITDPKRFHEKER